MGKKMSIKNTNVLILADQAIYSGVNFLITLLTARTLTANDFGRYSAIILMTYLFISGISAWTIQVFQVSTNRTNEYINFVFWVQLVLTIIILVAVKICMSISDAALLYGAGLIMHDFSRKLLLTMDKTMTTLIMDAITAIFLIIAYGIFWHGGSQHLDGLLYYFTVAYLISLIYLLIVIRPNKINRSTIIKFLGHHYEKGKWLFLTAVGQWWAANLFVVASGLYLGAAALGALRLGQSIFGILNLFLQTFENYVLPQTVTKMHLDQSAGLEYLKHMNQKLFYVFIPVLIILFFYSNLIMAFIGGKEFAAYAFVLKGLSMLYVFILFSQPLRFFIRSMQLNDHFFYAYLFSLIFAFSTSHWLISTYGLYGVIAGLTGSQLVLMAYWTIILQFKNIKIWKSYISY